MVESIGVYLALKITNHKHHLILKLGQINPKFEISMTQPGQAGTIQVEITILLLINSLGSPANA